MPLYLCLSMVYAIMVWCMPAMVYDMAYAIMCGVRHHVWCEPAMVYGVWYGVRHHMW